MGDLPAQPRRADARDGDRRASATICGTTYAADRRARINLGIRRRLAPLLENDRRKIELMNGLLLSMPGTPVIYYGDEIGMGDNIYLGDRDGVRTPMQWSPDRNGGFSRADPAALYAAADHGPGLRLRGGQRRGADARARLAAELDEAHDRGAPARSRAFGRGTLRFLYPATARSWPICASTRARRSCASPTCRARRRRSSSTSSDFRGRVPVELLGRSAFPPIGELPYLLTLPAYGFYWFELAATAESEPAVARRRRRSCVTLVSCRTAGETCSRGRNLPQLERDVIPRFICRAALVRRQGPEIRSVARAGDIAALPSRAGEDGFLLPRVERVELSRPRAAALLLPLAACGRGPGRTRAAPALRLARVARSSAARARWSTPPRRTGSRWRCSTRIDGRRGDRRPTGGGTIRFRPTPLCAETAMPERLVVRRLGAEQSNTSVAVRGTRGAQDLSARCSRACTRRSRWAAFLAERAGFANTPPLLGDVSSTLDAGGGRDDTALGVLQRIRPQPGRRLDAGAQLSVALSRRRARGRSRSGAARPTLDGAARPGSTFLGLARQLGLRTGRDAPRARRIRRRRPGLRAGADHPGRHRAVAAELRTAAGQLAPAARDRDRLPEPVRDAAPIRCSARDALDAALSGRWRRTTSPAVKSPRTTATIIWGRCWSAQNDFYHHRFRGRAVAAAGAAPAQEFAAARCRRHDPLVRLRRRARPCGDSPSARPADVAARRRARRGLAAARMTAALPAGLPRGDARLAGLSGQQMQGKALIDFFMLEKASTKSITKLANRPDWVAIPLAGILACSTRRSGRMTRRDRECRDRPQRRTSRRSSNARHGDPFAFLGMHQSSAGL